MNFNKEGLYTREDLLNLGIYELRDLGRDVGVHSPTTLKKEALVDNILSIIYGEIPKQVIGKTRGRPARKKEKPNNLFVDLIERVKEPDNNAYFMGDEGYSYQLKDLLSTKVASFNSTYVNSAEDNAGNFLRSGVLCEEGNNFYIRKLKFIKSDDDVEISKNIVKSYNLKENDRIEYLVDNEQQELLQVFKVNGEYATRINTKNSNLDEEAKGEFYVEQAKILLNKSNVIYASTVQDRERIVDCVCERLENLNYNTVKVCFDRNIAEKTENSGVIKAEIYSSCIGDEYETMMMAESGIDKAVFFSLLNKKSVLVIDNLAWLIKVINTYPKSIYGNFIEKMVKTCKNSNITLVCLSGHLSNETVKDLLGCFDNVNL